MKNLLISAAASSSCPALCDTCINPPVQCQTCLPNQFMSNDRLACISKSTKATRRQMPYKQRQICRKSSVFICTLEKQNVTKNARYIKSFHMLRQLSLLPRYQNFKFVTLKKQIKLISCNFRNGIRQQISKSLKVVQCIFALPLTVSEILTL